MYEWYLEYACIVLALWGAFSFIFWLNLIDSNTFSWRNDMGRNEFYLSGLNKYYWWTSTCIYEWKDKVPSLMPKISSPSVLYSSYLYYLSKCLFIYFDREKSTCMRESWAGAERGRQRIPSRLQAISTEPVRGSNSRTMRSWPELKSSRKLNQLSHPGAPPLLLFKNIVDWTFWLTFF